MILIEEYLQQHSLVFQIEIQISNYCRWYEDAQKEATGAYTPPPYYVKEGPMPTISGVITISNFVSLHFFWKLFRIFWKDWKMKNVIIVKSAMKCSPQQSLEVFCVSDHTWPPQIRLPLLTHHPDLRVGDLRLHVLQLLLEGAGTPSARPGSQKHPHDHFHPGRNGKTGWFECNSVWRVYGVNSTVTKTKSLNWNFFQTSFMKVKE